MYYILLMLVFVGTQFSILPWVSDTDIWVVPVHLCKIVVFINLYNYHKVPKSYFLYRYDQNTLIVISCPYPTVL